MSLTVSFIINSIILGAGLAMDAFSVSLANGLNNTKMKAAEMGRIAGCFAFFQWFMPLAGWACIHTIVLYFRSFQMFIPWIALVLLSYIGGKMIFEGIKKNYALFIYNKALMNLSLFLLNKQVLWGTVHS